MGKTLHLWSFLRSTSRKSRWILCCEIYPKTFSLFLSLSFSRSLSWQKFPTSLCDYIEIKETVKLHVINSAKTAWSFAVPNLCNHACYSVESWRETREVNVRVQAHAWSELFFRQVNARDDRARFTRVYSNGHRPCFSFTWTPPFSEETSSEGSSLLRVYACTHANLRAAEIVGTIPCRKWRMGGLYDCLRWKWVIAE